MSDTYQVPIRVVLEGTIEIEDCDSMEEAEIQALEEARRQLGQRRGAQDLEVTDLETRC
jgi:hypothetical protein